MTDSYMEKIIIEWLHYDRGGQTCCRCSDSSESIKNVIGKIKPLLKTKNIELELKETLLDEKNIDLSNTVRINGKDIMKLLNEKHGITTACPSCSELIGKSINCQTFVYLCNTYDALPEQMLWEAILKEASLLQ